MIDLFVWFSTRTTPTRFLTTPRAYSQHILIRVVHCSLHVHYRAELTETMDNVRRFLATRINEPTEQILLLYRGVRVKDADTAMKLGLKEGDIVEALSRPSVHSP